MYADDKSFENDVRRIARLLWPAASFGGARIEDGRERDGVFITDEAVHLLECTTSRSKAKAIQDVKKLETLVQQYRKKYALKSVKGWFVTLNEPTADQRDVVHTNSSAVVAVSFRQFKSQIIDADTYIELRKQRPFGSMEDLSVDENDETRRFYYIKQSIVSDETGREWTAYELADSVLNGDRFILSGDYGAGKSTTTREIFYHLANKYRKNRISRFPIILNLRNHHGQSDPVEAIERHGRYIAYPQPHHLVRAWLAGDAILILDGFDEIATPAWTGHAKKLRRLRYESMELIRKFIEETPEGSGIIISGRSYFFDNDKELQSALGIGIYGKRFTQVSLSDFNEQQMKAFLEKQDWRGAIPSWFPSRPLLLGYLAVKGLLDPLMAIETGLSPAVGWNELLTRIGHREAKIEAGIDGEVVRRLIEHLATITRRSTNGVGPLSQNDILQAFFDICGYYPDDRGIVLLQRLPGLGRTKQEDGSRDFIDSDFAEAARAGDVVRYIENPYSSEIGDPSTWQITLSQLGRSLAAYLCKEKGFSEMKISSALQRSGDIPGYGFLCSDIIEVAKEMEYSYKGPLINVQDVLVQETSFGDTGQNYSAINYRNCLFKQLEIPPDAEQELLPKFFDCYFSAVEGRVSLSDLPKEIFDSNCQIDSFGDSSSSTSSIMALSLPTGARVLLTILKKLYLQPGSGRKESALFRGLDPRSKLLVPEILQLLRRERLAIKSSTADEVVWLPTRANGVRVRRLISAPASTEDDLLEKAARLG